MIYSRLASALLAVGAIASPLQKRQSTAPTDVQILNYALTLEFLEENFYAGALGKFAASDFASAGFPSWVRERFEQIYSHEQAHVAFLKTALGSSATAACNYSFPYTDPKSFAAMSMVLEGVGVTAYLGAAQFISNKDYLTAAGSILTTESRHAAWVASAVNMGTPWSGAFDVPLDFDEVYSLASAFITGCPSSNPALPVKAFPVLTVTPATPAPGANVTLHFNGTGAGDSFVLFTGLSSYALPITNGTATLPSNLTGTVYGVVSSNATSVTDDTILAGPAILLFPDPFSST